MKKKFLNKTKINVTFQQRNSPTGKIIIFINKLFFMEVTSDMSFTSKTYPDNTNIFYLRLFLSRITDLKYK